MNVVMVHPIHGAKVAINDQEIEMDEKNGWSRYNADTPTPEKPKRKYTRKAAAPLEQPNSNALASDDFEGT